MDTRTFPTPYTFRAPLIKTFPVKVLLVDDQEIVGKAVQQMLKEESDISFYFCQDPAKAISMATEIHPTVILQDLLMPDIDGLMLVQYFRANPATKDIPMIVLSTKEEPNVKAEAFALGANDYIVKLPDKIELLARIRYHSSAYIRLLERNLAYERLEESQKILKADLADAAEYVKSLLPLPLKGEVEAESIYIPSTELGGDTFGYHWIDSNHFALYLIDVCGHGVGAALLSITVLTVLKSQSLPHANFLLPQQVLEALNETFPMENHHHMFFTIWYGIFNKKKRQLTFSSGGHPPAILFTGDTQQTASLKELRTPGIVIGGMQDAQYISETVDIGKYNKLYIFSDGVYEFPKSDGNFFQLEGFISVLKNAHQKENKDLQEIVNQVKALQKGNESFPDDFSITRLIFS